MNRFDAGPSLPAADPVPVAGAAGSALRDALHAWVEQCEAAAAASSTGDITALERALALRDALRPRIEEMMRRIHRAGAASTHLRAEVAQLGRKAAGADARLTAMLEAESVRLRAEVDTLQRGTGPVAAYRRPDAPNPHRLNIVR